jgi:sodium/hydrogen antiporter
LLAVFFAFLGARESRAERIALGYFGIRGIGTLFYLFYAVSHGFKEDALVAPMISLAVLISIGFYGLTGAAAMRRLERRGFSCRDDESFDGHMKCQSGQPRIF